MTKSLRARGFDLRLPDGSLIPINKEKLLVGSSSKCDVLLEDKSVSAYHAMLFADEDGLVTVLDLDSVNGVFVAGTKIANRSFVGEGDSVTFGKVHLTLTACLEDAVFEKEDAQVEEIQDQEEKIYVPQRSSDNEALIDG